MTDDGLVLARQLASDGFARLVGSGADRDAVAHLYSEAERYFARPEETKRRQASADFNFGFRPFGRQYSITPDRPDLNESFTYWADSAETIPFHEEIADFVGALHAFWAVVSRIADSALSGVAAHFGVDDPVPFERSSYIEVNNYFPIEDRDLLQDRHEDGHLLTLVTANAPGLEIELPTGMTPVEFVEGEIVVMPGSLLTDLTGGWVSPLYHQVRNHRCPTRTAILFLVNPAFDVELKPYAAGGDVDIAALARVTGQKFGLPEGPVLATRRSGEAEAG